MIDRFGRWVVEPRFASAYPFRPSASATSIRLSQDGPYQIIDRQGNALLDRPFDYLRYVSEGLVPFGRKAANGRIQFGIVDPTGKEVVPPSFTECDYGFREGLLGVEIDNDKWGVIDKTGHWVIRPSYEFVGECRNGLLLAYKGGKRTFDRALKGGKFGYVKPSGEVAIDFQLDQAWPFNDGIGSVEWHANLRGDEYDTALGYVSVDGRIIWREKVSPK